MKVRLQRSGNGVGDSTSGPRAARGAGFTLVELMVASSLAAVFLTAAALAFAAITTNQDARRPGGPVTVGSANLKNFFGAQAPDLLDEGGTPTGVTDPVRVIAWCPNYAKVAEIEMLRSMFWEDVQSASAVYCLPRAGRNGKGADLTPYRPNLIPLPITADGRDLDSSADFRALLESVTEASGIFSSFRGVPAASDPNGSIFVIQPSNFVTALNVRAIYEIDFVQCSEPEGKYVTVRRYEGTELTFSVELFYPIPPNTTIGDGQDPQPFAPLFVQFERRDRLVHDEPDHDEFKVAANRPFYFVWWPDPADPYLVPGRAGAIPSYAATDPRSNYASMGGRTSFFFVVPMFPSL